MWAAAGVMQAYNAYRLERGGWVTRRHSARTIQRIYRGWLVAEAPWSGAEWAVALSFAHPRATALVLLLG